jgi:hypothetical protein
VATVSAKGLAAIIQRCDHRSDPSDKTEAVVHYARAAPSALIAVAAADRAAVGQRRDRAGDGKGGGVEDARATPAPAIAPAWASAKPPLAVTSAALARPLTIMRDLRTPATP